MEFLIFMFNSGCLGKFNVAFGCFFVVFFFLGRALNALKNSFAYTITFRKNT